MSEPLFVVSVRTALACALAALPAVAQLTPEHAAIFEQDTPYFPDISESTDELGFALAVGDFDGNGVADVAIGAPGEDLVGADNGGQVTVMYGALGGLDPAVAETWQQSNGLIEDDAELGDRFAHALAAGDFDGDGFTDLAVGIPYEDVVYNATDRANAGAVAVIYGDAGGLHHLGNQFLHQGTAGIQAVPEQGDNFGFALAAGDFNADGFADLAVGAPGEDVFDNGATDADAGVVHVIYGSPVGLRADGAAVIDDQLLTQADFGTLIEPGDRFGYALAAGDFDPFFTPSPDDLAIGAPFEDYLAEVDAGLVAVASGTFASGLNAAGGDVFFQAQLGTSPTQEDDQFGFHLAAGDFDGDGSDDLAVGVPGQGSSGNGTDWGWVDVLFGSPGVGLTVADATAVWRSFLVGQGAAGDRFGERVAAGDFDGNGYDELVIAAPDVPIGAAAFAGYVYVVAGNAHRGFGPTTVLGQGEHGPGAVEQGDQIGHALAVGDFDGDGFEDLMFGAPFEDTPSGALNAGAVSLFYSATLFSDGFESGDTADWSATVP